MIFSPLSCRGGSSHPQINPLGRLPTAWTQDLRLPPSKPDPRHVANIQPEKGVCRKRERRLTKEENKRTKSRTPTFRPVFAKSAKQGRVRRAREFARRTLQVYCRATAAPPGVQLGRRAMQHPLQSRSGAAHERAPFPSRTVTFP